MALKLMYITNRLDVAKVVQDVGVDRIFVDLEYIGKAVRQGKMDTVQNYHTIEDVRKIRKVVTTSELLVRVNPIHSETTEYCSSEKEICDVIEAGADMIMLPYFKSVSEVQTFLDIVNGRCQTMLLFETYESIDCIEDILALDGIDEVYIGLNDLSLESNRKFMFELLADGTVEKIVDVFKTYNKPFGFGGIAALSNGLLPAEYIIREHYKLKSSCVILSRSFCNCKKTSDIDTISQIFTDGIRDIREFEKQCESEVIDDSNLAEIRRRVELIVKG